MNNEDTLYLNNEKDNHVLDETTNPIPPKAKKDGVSSKTKVAVAGAAGVAAGTVFGASAVGIAVAANQNHEEPISETTETESKPEASDAIVADAEPTSPTEESQHAAHVINNYYTTEVHNHPEPIAEAHAEEPMATPVQQEIVAEPVDNEVRILGVETVQTPEGHSIDVVGVSIGDDPALLVDVNQDGYLDVLIHDDNKNGQIEENEIHDISDANMHITDLGIQMSHNDFYMASDETPMDNFDDPNVMPV